MHRYSVRRRLVALVMGLCASVSLAGCSGTHDGVAADVSRQESQGQAGDAMIRAGAIPVLRIAAFPASTTGAAGAGRSVPIRLTREMARQAIRHGELTVELADGTRYPIRMEREQPEAGGRSTFIGRVQTRAGMQTAVLTFGPDAVFGVLPRPDGRLMAVTTMRGVTRIGLDGGLVPKGKGDLGTSPDFVIPAGGAGAGRVPLQAMGKGRATRIPVHPEITAAQAATGDLEEVAIDLLVLYTDTLVELRGSVSAVETEIINLVAITNQAHLDSGSRVRFSLARTAQVQDVPDSSNRGILNDVTDNEVAGVDVTALRDDNAADMVVVVRPHLYGDLSCGIAWLQSYDQQGLNADESIAYSVVNVDESCGRYVFPHELGHNLGSAHDRETSTSDGTVQYGAYAYSFGFRQDGPPAFATIMAYEDGLPWVGYFSSPASTLCGAPCGEVDQADNVRSMNRVAPAIAAFRGPPGTLAISDAEGVEGIADEVTWIRVPIRLSGVAPAGGVTFNVRVVGGTATVSTDFEDAGVKSLTIVAGSREADFMLGVVGDDRIEGDETILLRVSDATNAGIDDAEAVATILDDDPRLRLEGRVLFPAGHAPPEESFRVTAFGPDGYRDSQRYFEVQPPDFRYSFPVVANAEVDLVSWVLPPFVALEKSVGQLSADTQSDYPVLLGKRVTVTLQAPASGPVPTEHTGLSISEAVDNKVRMNASTGLSPGDAFTTWVAPGSWVTIDATPPSPFLPWAAVNTRVEGDFSKTIVLSTTMPSLFVWGASPPREGRGSIGAAIELSAPAPEGGVTLFYHTVSGTAKAGEDYSPVSGMLTIPEGEYFKVIYFDVLDDDIVEADEYFDFEVTNVHGAIPSSPRMRLYLRNDDLPPPSLSLSGTTRSAEGPAGTDHAVEVTVALSTPAPGTGVSLFFHTVSGTAKAREDYAPVSGTLTFAAGETTKSFQVTILGDDQAEGDEYFDVEVANVRGAIPVSPRLRIDVINDDPP